MNILLIISLVFALFLLVFSVVHFSEKKFSKQHQESQNKDVAQVEGAQRAIYSIFYLLALWVVLMLLLPMLITIRSQLSTGMSWQEKLSVLLKVSYLPMILLLLMTYGARRGYLNWIRELYWPNDEDK
jgi:cytosine/uracil/thiamine/allantoin permease